MGEIADMMLEGLLDEETGEYIGEANLGVYGAEAPGFPISYEREAAPEKERADCPICGRRVKAVGLHQHVQDSHGEQR